MTLRSVILVLLIGAISSSPSLAACAPVEVVLEESLEEMTKVTELRVVRWSKPVFESAAHEEVSICYSPGQGELLKTESPIITSKRYLANRVLRL